NLEKRDVKEAPKNSECQENKNETRLEMHKDSKWQNSWEKFKNSNPAFSRLFRIIEIANSSKFFQKTNIITKKITNFITNLNSKTEIQTVVNELHQLDDTFSITSFLFYCETSFVPNVLESWMGGHSEILKDWCHEAVFNILTEPINQAKKRSAYWDNRIIDVSEIELVGAKMMEQGPVLIISFYSQQISCLRKVQSHELIDGDPDKVQKIANIWALCRDREVFGNNEAWKLIDANSSSCGDSWV
ncbi:MAG: Mitochondrial import inner membrane translocase subunit TIM44, partial [Marteilia pararefringens]